MIPGNCVCILCLHFAVKDNSNFLIPFCILPITLRKWDISASNRMHMKWYEFFSHLIGDQRFLPPFLGLMIRWLTIPTQCLLFKMLRSLEVCLVCTQNTYMSLLQIWCSTTYRSNLNTNELQMVFLKCVGNL